jgi:thiosulfate dehydrogenase [quinone] large subunit
MSALTAATVPSGTAVDAPVARHSALPIAIGATRILMGFYFLWAFLDKTLGLGFATPAERAWVAGGSPTTGFLTNATAESPFANVFAAIAGNPVVDWLIAGAAMLLLMYLAEFPLTLTGATNPLIDSHIIDMGVMAIVFFAVADQRLSVARIWRTVVGDKTWLW